MSYHIYIKDIVHNTYYTMRINEENKHSIKISEKQSMYQKQYYKNLTEEKKKSNKERAQQYYLDNKKKMNTQRKVNYYKKSVRQTDAELFECVIKKKEAKKKKLTEYLEKLLQ